MSSLVPPQTMGLQSRVYFLSSLCSTYQHHLTEAFSPLLKIWLPEPMLNGFLLTSLAIPLLWALLVSLNLFDSTPRLSLGPLSLFICTHSPGDLNQSYGNCYSLQTGFPASTIPLQWHSSQGIPVKVWIRSRNSLAQIPLKALLCFRRKAKVFIMAHEALHHKHL